MGQESQTLIPADVGRRVTDYVLAPEKVLVSTDVTKPLVFGLSVVGILAALASILTLAAYSKGGRCCRLCK